MQGFAKEQIDFMRQACLLCDNSKLNVRTGCVVVLEGDVIGEGWNQKEFNGDVVHAEVAAVRDVKKTSGDLMDASVFVSRFPCTKCAEMLVKKGIAKVFYMSDHFTSGNEALPIFEDADVKVIQIPEEVVWNSKE
jgi:tRNA(Arg) A34 adenosine deaminase TadA